MVTKTILFLMAVAFSARAWGIPGSVQYWHFWCGKFISIKGVDNVDALLAAEYPNYFSTARINRSDGMLVGTATLHKSIGTGGPTLSFFSEQSGRDVNHYRIFTFEGALHAPLNLGISDTGLKELDNKHVLAAWFNGGAILLSRDFEWLALCRYPLDIDFESLATFKRRTRGELNSSISYMRTCEVLLSTGDPRFSLQ